MESQCPMKCSCGTNETDQGSAPFVANIMCEARRNHNFRTAAWTGNHLQMTLMCIPGCGEIGVEMHPHTDQFIRVEEGQALICMGCCREELNTKCRLGAGDAVFVPEGTWHNVFNTGNGLLKLSSLYAPPQHPRGTVHRTKADAENGEHSGG